MKEMNAVSQLRQSIGDYLRFIGCTKELIPDNGEFIKVQRYK